MQLKMEGLCGKPVRRLEGNHTRIDSIVMRKVDDAGTYYLAYSTTGVQIDGSDEKSSVKQLFLQKIKISEDDREPEIGTPVLLYTLIDNDKDSEKDLQGRSSQTAV